MAKYKLVVCRISVHDGSFMLSRPCASCAQLITTVGIRQVFYSVESSISSDDEDSLITGDRHRKRMEETSLHPVVMESCKFYQEDSKRMEPPQHISHGFRYIQSKRKTGLDLCSKH